MARTLQQITVAHLGELTFQAIQLAAQNEALELRIAELEAQQPTDAPAPTTPAPLPSEPPA